MSDETQTRSRGEPPGPEALEQLQVRTPRAQLRLAPQR